ncbi:MAG TPA: SIMPL domain-containing protein [Candidatus Paceibacterota bacterium]|nr:SIMPL domain-containing protein [Candidatus Pacearchaeota archaeon]HRZ50412.1 SIMPL domain-containing protein [Candidatus Paceibacterota bacterium]HSA36133.1 SIMPL domain-containing protein [Candidatus Paceibacterota bacterium]
MDTENIEKSWHSSEFFWPSVVLGASLIVATMAGGQIFLKAKQLSNVLSVTGSAEQMVISDTVKWQSAISRSVDSASLKEGSSLMNKDQKIVSEFLKESGVMEQEITVSPVTVSPVCESQNNIYYDKFGNQSCGSSRTAGYNLQQVITVESQKVPEVTKISQTASDYFIGQGVIFTTQSLEYYYSKLADLRLDLLSRATVDAKARAEKIVESTGKQIESLQAASMGVFQVTAKNSVEVSDYGVYDTASLEKKVTGVVRVSFSIK